MTLEVDRGMFEGPRDMVNAGEARSLALRLCSDLLESWPKGKREAAEKWLAGAGKNNLLRRGRLVRWPEEPSDLEGAPAWAERKLAEGRELWRLEPSEEDGLRLRQALMLVMDARWSQSAGRLGVEAALSLSERSAPKGPSARRSSEPESFDADCAAIEEERLPVACEGGRVWVRLGGEASRRSEGSRMRHCLGEREEAESQLMHFSLRDKSGRSLLTASARPGALLELKAFANLPCPKALASDAGALARWVGAHLGTPESSGSDWAAAGVAAVRGIGFVSDEAGWIDAQAKAIRQLEDQSRGAGTASWRRACSSLMEAASEAGWEDGFSLAASGFSDPAAWGAAHAAPWGRPEMVVALGWACHAGFTAWAEKLCSLLPQGALDEASALCGQPLPPLLRAARNGHWALASALLARGADPSRRDGSGLGALHLAALAGKSEFALELIGRGAPSGAMLSGEFVSTRSKGLMGARTAADIAALALRPGVFEALVQAGAPAPEAGRKGSKLRAFLEAAKNGSCPHEAKAAGKILALTPPSA